MTKPNTAIGPTKELDLRVSISTLSPVIFSRPGDGLTMLALERKATLVSENNPREVQISAQPFGGAVRIRRTTALVELVGEFHFDSVRSRKEQDFRIFIKSSSWEKLKDYCYNNILHNMDAFIDSDPTRELVEEIEDTLGEELRSDQYRISNPKLLVEEDPFPTKNLCAPGALTVRIYRIDRVEILDPALVTRMIENSESYFDQWLGERALENYQAGGRGHANAMLVAPFRELRDLYQKTHLKDHGGVLQYQGTTLAGNVPAILTILE